MIAQVFGQCRNWLRLNLPDVDLAEVSSTPRAAEVHGLQILDPSIQDIATNTTRFLVIFVPPPPPAFQSAILHCVSPPPSPTAKLRSE